MSAFIGELSFPFPLIGLSPPYDRLMLTSLVALKQGTSPGYMTAIVIPNASVATEVLTKCVAEVRRAAPFAPAILLLSEEDTRNAVRLATYASLLKVRAVLVPRGPIAPHFRSSASASSTAFLSSEDVKTLRQLMTDQSKFGADFTEWLDLVRGPLPVRTQGLISRLVHAGNRARLIRSALAVAAVSERTARRRLAAAKLPSAGHFVRLGRVAPILLTLFNENPKAASSRFSETTTAAPLIPFGGR